MKKLILGMAIVASAFAFGQKEDVNAKLQATNKTLWMLIMQKLCSSST
jgi:hypothetical protein